MKKTNKKQVVKAKKKPVIKTAKKRVTKIIKKLVAKISKKRVVKTTKKAIAKKPTKKPIVRTTKKILAELVLIEKEGQIYQLMIADAQKKKLPEIVKYANAELKRLAGKQNLIFKKLNLA